MPEPMEIADMQTIKKRWYNSALVVHCRALLSKNILLLFRNKTATIIQLASPVLVCLYLVLIQSVVNNYISSTANPNPQVYPATIPTCWGSDCVTLEIVITGNSSDWTDFVIPHIAKSTGLRIGKDIKVSEQTALSFFNSLEANQNRTQTGLILCNAELDFPENPLLTSMPCKTYNQTGYFYSIVYNYTSIMRQDFTSFNPHYFSPGAIGVKIAVDNAILAYENSKLLFGKSPQVQSKYQSFPSAVNRFMVNYDVTSVQGPLYFFIPPMILFGMIVSEIAREKEHKLRFGLIVTGVSHWEFWLSWFLVAFCIVFLSSNIQIFAGYACDFDFFLKTPYL